MAIPKPNKQQPLDILQQMFNDVVSGDSYAMHLGRQTDSARSLSKLARH